MILRRWPKCFAREWNMRRPTEPCESASKKILIPDIFPNLKRCLFYFHVHKSTDIKLGVGFLRN